MAEAVQIRVAGPEDTQTVVRLWEELMSHHLEHDPRFAMVENAPEVYERFLRGVFEKDEYAVLLAEKDERGVGYAILAILDNPAVFHLSCYGFLSEMCVSRETRGEGVGRLLWDRAVRWFKGRGVDVIQLNVAVLNQSGERFWRSVGCQDYLHVLWYDIPKSIPGEGL